MREKLTPTLEWPAFSRPRPRFLAGLANALVDVRLWQRLLAVLGLGTAYVVLVATNPTWLPADAFTGARDGWWWALDFVLMVGSGGAIAAPGIASLGLLGGLLVLHRTHRAVRNGVRTVDAVITLETVPLTLLCSAGLTLYYASFATGWSFWTWMLYGVAVFACSMLVQMLNAELYRRTGASFMGVNVALAFFLFMSESGLRVQEHGILAGLVVAGVLWLVVRRSRPVQVPIESGEPPRIETLESFPSVDFRWLHAFALWMVALVILGSALWTTFIALEVEPHVVWVIGFVLFAGAAELVYRLNSRIAVYTEFDPDMLARHMAQNYLTVRDVDPGSQTRAFFRSQLWRAQRHAQVVVLLVMLGSGILVAGVSPMTPQVGTLLASVPLVLALVARGLYAFVSFLSGVYTDARQSATAPQGVHLAAETYLRPEGVSSLTLQMDDQRLVQMLENVLELVEAYLPTKGDGSRAIMQYLEEQGAFADPRKRVLVKAVLDASIRGIPVSDATVREPMTRKRALTIMKAHVIAGMLTFVLGLLGCLVVVAMVTQLIDISISVEGFILLVLGIMIPFAIGDLRDPQFQLAVRFLFGELGRAISRVFRGRRGR